MRRNTFWRRTGSHRARTWPVSLWWGLFVLSVLFNRYDGTRCEDAESVVEIRGAAVQYMTADAVHMSSRTRRPDGSPCLKD
ncbi:hypothetical protein [Streptomyces viridochromogenes]|uniref:hypothetical protein n=1 Tax=Streptomyces viridochromogenes TaxID=1938 RepID=UPI0013313F75|nr:hypothetical protein [Streptomyces viridochromogenes]